MALLEVENLSIAVAGASKWIPVVEDCSFSVEERQTLGVVGESGCGKSLTAMAIMGLLEESQVRVTAGKIVFDNENLLNLPPNQRRKIMGDKMSMIFQEPMTSLNPVYRIGDQIVEAIKQHRKMSAAQYRTRALELLKLVKIPNHTQRIDSYPHQLSGGQRQRVMIAMALSCEPKLLIADEPTTALDVTVQKEVLQLMLDLQDRTGTAIVLISHDLGVIAETCNEVAVMYRGRIVESSTTKELFGNIQHPYTHGLLKSIPSIDAEAEWLDAIPGRVPTLEENLAGCAFHPRCPHAQSECTDTQPSALCTKSDYVVRCHFVGKLE